MIGYPQNMLKADSQQKPTGPTIDVKLIKKSQASREWVKLDRKTRPV